MAGMWYQSKQIISPWRPSFGKLLTQHHNVNAYSECSFVSKDTTYRLGTRKAKICFLLTPSAEPSYPMQTCLSLCTNWRRLITRPQFLSVMPDGIKLKLHQRMILSSRNCARSYSAAGPCAELMFLSAYTLILIYEMSSHFRVKWFLKGSNWSYQPHFASN